MEIAGYQRVGKGFWVRYQLLSVDPLTEEKTPVPNAPLVSMSVIRPNKTTLATKMLGAGVNNLGGGWYAASFTPDVAGRHTVKIEARVPGGEEDRVRESLVVHSY